MRSAKFKAVANEIEMGTAPPLRLTLGETRYFVQSREAVVNIPKCRISLPLVHLLCALLLDGRKIAQSVY
jgi:hypothetical protein